MAIWTSLQADENVVLWYFGADAPPRKCGQGSLDIEPELYAWVCQTAAAMDVINFAGREVVVRQPNEPAGLWS